MRRYGTAFAAPSAALAFYVRGQSDVAQFYVIFLVLFDLRFKVAASFNVRRWGVADNLSFDAEQFLALPAKDRVRLCKHLAERAQELADAAEPKHRPAYLEIAKQWLTLADEIERVASESESVKTSH